MSNLYGKSTRAGFTVVKRSVLDVLELRVAADAACTVLAYLPVARPIPFPSPGDHTDTEPTTAWEKLSMNISQTHQSRRRDSSVHKGMLRPRESVQSPSQAQNFVKSAESLPHSVQIAIDLHGQTIVKGIHGEMQTLVHLVKQAGVFQNRSPLLGVDNETSSSELEEYRKLHEAAKETIKELQKMLEEERVRYRDLTREKEEMMATHQRDYHELRITNKMSLMTEQKLLQQFEDEQERCRRLFGHIQEIKGGIRVMCRIRQALPREAAMELVNFGLQERGNLSKHWARMLLPSQRVRADGQPTTEVKEYNLERIFGPGDGNEAIFGEINDLVLGALQGGKATIFCYGQSGSGKTFTMSHQENPNHVGPGDGIMPQALAMLFRQAEEQSEKYKYELRFSTVEIYKEVMYDLELADDRGRFCRVSGNDPSLATKFLVSRLKGVLGDDGVLKQIRDKRAISATKLNDQSSRSHLILSCYIKRSQLRGMNAGAVSEGVLNLVDLAGSERVGQAGTEGSQLQEGIAINQSLLSLTMAIASLGEEKQPTSTTALTKFLNPCFKTGCKVLMLVNVIPLQRDMAVTLQTLSRAAEASKARLAEVKRTQKKAQSPAKTPSPVVTSSTPRGAVTSSAILAGSAGRASTSVPTPSLRRSAAQSMLRPHGASLSATPRRR
ncbi:ATP-binding cassette transporter snq2 [Pestalotiopsis sp. IQ-011]